MMKKLLYGLSALGVVLFVYALYSQTGGVVSKAMNMAFLKNYAVPTLGLSLISFICLYLPRVVQSYFIIIFFSCVAALYSAEFFLLYKYYDADSRRHDAAARYSIEPDDRSQHEVWESLANQHGKDNVFPMIGFSSLLGDDLLPLGTVPSAKIVYCNEAGYTLVFDSDRHGFRNPDAVWDQTGGVVLVGDSFGQGACLKEGVDVGSLLRLGLPGLVNLSRGGTSAPHHLASYVEYGQHVKPKYVIYMHYEGNDFRGLNEYDKIPHGKRYLNDADYSQDLISRGPEIRHLMAEYFYQQGLERIKEKAATIFERIFSEDLGVKGLLKLTSLRQVMGLVNYAGDDVRWDDFMAYVKTLNQRVEADGAKMLFVNIPGTNGLASKSELSAKVESIMAESGIAYIDMGQLSREAFDNPFDLFIWGVNGGHFSPEGAQLTAKAVSEFINK